MSNCNKTLSFVLALSILCTWALNLSYLPGISGPFWSAFDVRRRLLRDAGFGASYEEKLRLVDEALASRVFEANVNQFPVLTDLFREYEKARDFYKIENFKFSDVDDSCQQAYEDSVSNAGDFDKDYYNDREYLYKMIYLNKTDVKIRVCNTGAEFGCCQEPLVDDCCFCTYNGKKNIYEDVLPYHKPLMTADPTMRSFNLMAADQTKDLKDLYGDVLRRLGYNGTLKSYKDLKNFSYMPPEGFLMWHTNQYDNAQVAYRIYIIAVSEDGESAFKYVLPDGKLVEVLDFHGAVRIFKNTNVDRKTGEALHLWHTVYSKNTHRYSIGFEIHPEQIVALLDDCGLRCWQGFQEMAMNPFY